MNRRQLTFAAGACLAAPDIVLAAAPTLTGHLRAAQQPPARFLIVLLHGYDSSGGEILSLTRNLRSFAPTAALAAPNGPVGMGIGAHSWLPRGRGRGRPTPVEIAAAIDAYADAELVRLGLTPDRLILLGFSQGAGMALNVGLRRPVAPAAIIAFSGPFLEPDPLAAGKPQVLLVQGVDDAVANPRSAQDIVERLTAAGIPVSSHVLGGLGHTIDQRGVDLAGALLRRVTA